MARQGARVIAVDPSLHRIETARANVERAEVKVELHQSDLAELPFVRADSIDVALSVFALANVDDLDRVFRQVHRVLHPECAFVFSLPHPAYAMLDPDDADADGAQVVRSYFDRSVRPWFTDTDQGEERIRTIGDLHTSLSRANFRVDTILEPEPAGGNHSAVLDRRHGAGPRPRSSSGPARKASSRGRSGHHLDRRRRRRRPPQPARQAQRPRPAPHGRPSSRPASRWPTIRSVRAVVLSGEGRAFCAGLDLAAFQQMAGRPRRSDGDSADGDADDASGIMATGERETHLGQEAGWVWRRLEVPVIAAITGPCLGGGLQIALGADIRIVAPDAKLSVLEMRWGLIPDMTGTWLLPRLVGDDVARELTYTGRMISGEEAVAIGLCTRVSDDPRAEALALAAEIAGKSPVAIRQAKRLLDASTTPGRTARRAVPRRAHHHGVAHRQPRQRRGRHRLLREARPGLPRPDLTAAEPRSPDRASRALRTRRASSTARRSMPPGSGQALHRVAERDLVRRVAEGQRPAGAVVAEGADAAERPARRAGRLEDDAEADRQAAAELGARPPGSATSGRSCRR